MIIIFGIVCAIAGFAMGWFICRKELLLNLSEKSAISKEVLTEEFQKDF
jgi:uncharacterized protein YneF (UPF0154 family)